MTKKARTPCRALFFCMRLYETAAVLLCRFSSERFPLVEVLDELRDLHPEVNALDAIHALVSVHFFEMGGKRFLPPLERYDVRVLLNVEIQPDRKIMFSDLGIHLHDLFF